MMKPPSRHAGFTLVEVAIVMVIVGLAMVGIIAAMVGFKGVQNRKDTATRLAAVDAAIVNFVTQNRRLPCPANGTLASGALNAGVEQRNGTGDCTSMNTGVVPWVTLGISEGVAVDAWNNRLTYRVPTGANGFTRNLAFDMSACDPAGTGPVNAGPPITCQTRGPCAAAAPASCTTPANYLVNRGLQVQTVGGAVVMSPAAGTGAAYIVVSTGDNQGGAYNTGGLIMAAVGPALGTGETTNANNQALLGAYVDDNLSDASTAAHFDDIVSRPSILAVLAKAQLGPRGF